RSSHNRNLPTFPTRRSSDLNFAGTVLGIVTDAAHGGVQILPGLVLAWRDMARDAITLEHRLAVGPGFFLVGVAHHFGARRHGDGDRKSTRLNSSHGSNSYAV